MVQNLEIITVNYNTPDFVERLICSVREIEGDYPIRVIDGSDTPRYQEEVSRLGDRYGFITIEQMGYNIHHGRGMHYALMTSFIAGYEWCLIIDSDNYLQQPVIEKMMSLATGEIKIVGWEMPVNDAGVNDPNGFPYYHPSLLLFNTAYYRYLFSRGVTFTHHGAPCIRIMQYLDRHGLSHKVGIDMFKGLGIDKADIGKYTVLTSRGTVNKFGYNIKN
jgi:glycosyltransferase involved in cell wall biosynthesis